MELHEVYIAVCVAIYIHKNSMRQVRLKECNCRKATQRSSSLNGVFNQNLSCPDILNHYTTLVLKHGPSEFKEFKLTYD